MVRGKDRAWRAFEITGDEVKFTREIRDIMLKMAELENRIELIGQTEANIQSINEYCELSRHNLGNLSFSEKRRALESLGVRVIAGRGNLRLKGTLPIVSSQCA